MNTRVYKLLKECTEPSIDGEHHLPYVDQEKFAELMIIECAQVCMDLQTPTDFTYKSSLEYSRAIKQHFGVK